MRGFGLALALLLAALPAAAKESRAPAQTSKTIAEAVEAAETAHDIQREFPGEASEQKVDRAPPRMEAPPQPSDTPDWLERLFKFLEPLFKIIGWLLLAALGAVIGYALLRLVMSYINRPRRPDDDAATEALIDIDAEAAQTWLDDAEQLASAGRYGDAVHALLLRAIEHLRHRAGRAIPRAWTAREILTQLPITTLARALLQLLVQTTEQAHFAGRAIGAGDFARCKASFEQLLGLQQVRAAA